MCKSYPRESKGELLHCAVYSLTASLIMIICRSDDSCSILATFISFSTYKLYETIHSQRFVSTQRGYKIHTSWLQWQQQLLQTFFSDDLLTPPARNHQACRLLRQESWEGTRDAEALGGLWVPLGTRFSGLRKLNYLLSCICCCGWLRGRKSLFTNPCWIARFVELLISFATLSVIALMDILFTYLKSTLL